MNDNPSGRVRVVRLAPVMALGATCLSLLSCDALFGLDQVSEPQYANYYTCDCSCSRRVIAANGAAVLAGPAQLPVRGIVNLGAIGSILSGPVEAVLNGVLVTWWEVEFDVGVEGWVTDVGLVVANETLVTKAAQTCVPPEFNKNLEGGSTPNQAQLQQVCSADVAVEAQITVAQKLAPSKFFCQCNAQNIQFVNYNESCDQPCPNGKDVCLLAGSDPPEPTPTLMPEALFQPVSSCLVTGGATLVVGGHTPKTQPNVEGYAQIYGRPCPPGAGCLARLAFQLTGDDIEFDSGTIFASDPKFVDLSLSGATLPDAINLGPFLGGYIGEIPAGTALSSVHGRRSGTTEPFGADGNNAEGIALAMNWTGKSCRIAGQLFGEAQGDEGEGTLDAQLDVELDGVLDNQPPKPNAGADQTLECTSTAGATVTLNASGSTDADNNIAFYEWRSGSATGTQLAAPSVSPSVQTTQVLGQQTYHLLVVDNQFAADTDSVSVSVEDTTGAEISCNSPATIVPSDVPEKRTEGISFTATANDLCSGVSGVAIASYSCTRPRSCRVGIYGDTITIYDSGGVDDIIQWTVEAEDGAGNKSQTSCELTVVKKK